MTLACRAQEISRFITTGVAGFSVLLIGPSPMAPQQGVPNDVKSMMFGSGKATDLDSADWITCSL